MIEECFVCLGDIYGCYIVCADCDDIFCSVDCFKKHLMLCEAEMIAKQREREREEREDALERAIDSEIDCRLGK